MKSAGFVIGRFNPMHLGHEKVINEMITKHGKDDSLIVIGSVNNKISLKNPLNYVQRKKLLRNLYDIKIVGLADQKHDSDWNESLMDLLQSIFPSYDEVVLYTGSHLDTKKFHLEDDFKMKVIDRTQLNISATEVRNKIYHHILAGNYKGEFLSYLKGVLPEKNIDETLQLVGDVFKNLLEEKI